MIFFSKVAFMSGQLMSEKDKPEFLLETEERGLVSVVSPAMVGELPWRQPLRLQAV